MGSPALPGVGGAPDTTQTALNNVLPLARNSEAPVGVGAVPDTIQTALTNVARPAGFFSKFFYKTALPFKIFFYICAFIIDFIAFVCTLGNFSLLGKGTLGLSGLSKRLDAELAQKSEANEARNRRIQVQRELELEAITRFEEKANRFRALKMAIRGGLRREVIVRIFEDFPPQDQEKIKRAMWDFSEGNRANADDWAGRVIYNQIQLADETDVRADIQRHTDITLDGGLFYIAVDKIIRDLYHESFLGI